MVNDSLIIPRAAQQDSGQYICNASNSAGFTEAFVVLDVESECARRRRDGAHAGVLHCSLGSLGLRGRWQTPPPHGPLALMDWPTP